MALGTPESGGTRSRVTAVRTHVVSAWESLALSGLLLIGLWLRLLTLAEIGALNADEAIPGLMARHIAWSGETPTFYYGQYYFGALEAYLLAGLFRLFGFHPMLLYVPPVACSLVLVWLIWVFAQQFAAA